MNKQLLLQGGRSIVPTLLESLPQVKVAYPRLTSLLLDVFRSRSCSDHRVASVHHPTAHLQAPLRASATGSAHPTYHVHHEKTAKWGLKLPKIQIEVNKRIIQVPANTSILEACKQENIYVPSLCYHPMLSVVGHCRVCLVELENKTTEDGKGKLVPACATKVEPGLKILTNSPQVRESVKQNIQFLRCRHPNACMTCEVNGNCEFQALAYRYEVEDILPNYLKKTRSDTLDVSSHALVRDMTKCILCSRCIRACSEIQGMNILGMVSRGGNEQVSTVGDLPLSETACISCGQCTAVCPVGALIEKPHMNKVMDLLTNRKGDEIIIAHTAPAVRVAISEEFGMEPGSISTGKMVASLKALGFDYVFDDNFTADLTIMEEAAEFVHRVTNGGILPMFTSCCPGWINLIEKTYPQMLPHLSTCKSPNAMMGTLIKTYFAQKLGVHPKKIINVSVMPCVAKKDEIARPQLSTEVDGVRLPDTDYVLTTRELGHLIHKQRIFFSSMPEAEFDNPLGMSTGAAALFGATGGVMEAALRTAHHMITGKDLDKVELHDVRSMTSGNHSFKEATINIAGIDVNCAVATGTKNIRDIVERILAGEKKWHLIEIMACPGGCIGGGGEPKSAVLDPQVIRKRIDAIYRIDNGSSVRMSHHNESVKELYEDFLGEPNSPSSKQFLHTKYTDRRHEVKGRAEDPFGMPNPIEIKEADHH